MNVVLIRVVGGAQGERAWLRDGQALTVGRSNWADLCVDDDLSLADVQFAFELKGGTCSVRNLAPGERQVFVNGRAVVDSVLHDQDSIQAGNSQFLVRIERPTAAIAEATGVERSKTTNLRVSRSATAAQAGVLRIAAARPHWNQLIHSLVGARTAALLANFKRARTERPRDIPDDQDLFQHAPPEIRVTDSLHLLPLDESRSILTQARDLGLRDAALLVVPTGPLDEFIVAHKLYWAWFSRPSLLAFQLAHGTAHLASQLLQGVYAVVAASATDDDVLAYCHAEDAQTIHQLIEALEVPVFEP